MQKFKLEIEINKPSQEVFNLFTDRTKMKQWQPGLLTDEKKTSKTGKEMYKLVFRIGKRNMKMTETIPLSQFPRHDISYRLKGIHHVVKNTFQAAGPQSTIWVMENEFRFRWLMKLAGMFIKNGLKQQSTIIMNNFKSFAEKAR